MLSVRVSGGADYRFYGRRESRIAAARSAPLGRRESRIAAVSKAASAF
jgi:hypothetical protein